MGQGRSLHGVESILFDKVRWNGIS